MATSEVSLVSLSDLLFETYDTVLSVCGGVPHRVSSEAGRHGHAGISAWISNAPGGQEERP